MTAYLLEPPRFDVAWLYENYERVRIIVPDKSEALAYRHRLDALYELVFEWAQKNFNPDEDYLVLTGNLNMLVIVSLALQSAWPRSIIKLLKYDFDRKIYREIRYGRIARTSS